MVSVVRRRRETRVGDEGKRKGEGVGGCRRKEVEWLVPVWPELAAKRSERHVVATALGHCTGRLGCSPLKFKRVVLHCFDMRFRLTELAPSTEWFAVNPQSCWSYVDGIICSFQNEESHVKTVRRYTKPLRRYFNGLLLNAREH